MELDTGSALSVISKADYKQLCPYLRLLRISVRLKTYTGEKVLPKGKKLKVNVTYRGKTQQLQAAICSEKRRAATFRT